MFGATRNPYDLDKTCGGSSGGAAAAVACGMLPFADGSDLAASLRNPGNYCNVVGFRPTPGRVPAWPAANAWDTQPVLGPIARTVADARVPALGDGRARIRARRCRSAEPGSRLREVAASGISGKCASPGRRDFGGLPVEPRVTAVLEQQRKVLESLGCIVEEACPDFTGATEAFETLRAVSFAQRYGAAAEDAPRRS